MTVLLIMIVWKPLIEDYLSYFDPAFPIIYQLDWLLIGIFLFMSVMIMSGADIQKDIWIILVGVAGGMAIESWGTQTNLWTYYTFERPPLWIIPAWPIASLAIDRLVIILQLITRRINRQSFKVMYWFVFPGFFLLMIHFIFPTLDKSLSWIASAITLGITLSPKDHRLALLTFIAGSSLGYFLEKWGTTRLCWNYYTLETPPLFAVFAHGLAAVAFWRSKSILLHLIENLIPKILAPFRFNKGPGIESNPPL